MVPKITRSLRYIAFGLFSLAVIWLTIAAGASTAYITADRTEHTFLAADNIWLNLLAGVAVGALFFLYVRSGLQAALRKRFFSTPEKSRKFRRILLCVIGAMGLLFVLSSQRMPGSDQYSIVKYAAAWKKGDYSSITSRGGYLDLFPNQWGIVYVLYLFSFIVGDYNFLAFQLVNVCCMVWFYRSAAVLADRMAPDGDGMNAGNVLMGLGILFIPLIMYCSFVYGTVISLGLSTAALVSLDRLREQYRFRSMLKICLLLFVAIIMKQNYMIFVLGFLIALILDAAEKANKKMIVPCIGLAFVLFFTGSISRLLVTGVTGVRARQDGGVSFVSFVAMGLQENEKLYDGWWNSYNVDSYSKYGYSQKNQSIAAMEEINQRRAAFAEVPEYAIRFFAGKNMSQWNNPNFQCFWISQVRDLPATDFDSPQWVDSALNIKGSVPLTGFLNRLQFVILLGAVLYMFLHREKGFIPACLCIIFAGGFVFHTFWEAKSQYTLPYFVLLFPLAAHGWKDLAEWLVRKPRMFSGILQSKKKMAVAAAVLIVAINFLVILQAGTVPFFNDTLRRAEDTKAYEEYLAGNLDYNTVRLRAGNYRLTCAADQGKYLSVPKSDNAETEIARTASPDGAATVRLMYETRTTDEIRLSFSQANKSLDVNGGTAADGAKVWSAKAGKAASQRWRLLRTDTPGEYLIFSQGNLVLTLNPNDGTLTLSPKTGDATQRWRLEPV